MSDKQSAGQKPAQVDEATKARRGKMKELAETRMRGKLIREGMKRSTEELRSLKERADALAAELGHGKGGGAKKGKAGA